ncbi:MAG: MFS transporter [Oscillospiraceae bacterium]|jgi:DHA1 family multidrug resistance protein-like MFS transporter|nr:MFS transporter [Oscillospiraceae bacterium]
MKRFLAVVAVFNLAASFTHPVTPTLFIGLGLSDYMFGLALACMMAGNFLFSPFWGRISGVIQSRNTVLIGAVGYAGAQLLFALARTQAQFLLARFLAGAFYGGAFVCILTYVVNTQPDERKRGQTLLTTATLQAVCGSLGYFIGGMLGEIHVYAAVIAQVVVLAGCGVLFRLTMRSDVQPTADKLPIKRLMREANPFQSFAQGRRFFGRVLGILFVLCALQNFSQTAFDHSFNYYVIDQIGLSTGSNGLIKFVMGMVTLLANFTLCRYLMRRTELRRSMVYVLLVGTACITVVPFLREAAPFLAVNVVFYALSAISIPLTQSMVAATPDADKNLVMGFYNAMKSFGGILGALIAGFTYVVSPLTPFVCCAVGFALAAGCAGLYRVKSGR